MAGATRTTVDAALKDLYLPKMVSTINEATVLLKYIEQKVDVTSVSGREATFPVNIRGTQGFGARPDGGALPAPQNQTYVEASVPYRYLYGTVRFTHPTIASTRDKKGSWIRVATAEMSGLDRDIHLDMNRMMFGWGYGVVGRLAANPAASATSYTVDPGHQIKVGMLLDVWDGITAASTDRGEVEVTAVSGNTITVAANAIDADTDDYLVRAGTADFSGGTVALYEMMGLMGIVDDDNYVTTLQGIDRSSYSEWEGNVLEHSTPGTAREITEAILDQAVMKGEEMAGKRGDLGITTPTQWRRIGQLLAPDRRYADVLTLEGGFTAVKWAGVPIAWDSACPPDENGNEMLFILHTPDLGRYQLADWDWDDEDGNVLHRNEGYATYDGTLYYYGNFGCSDPAAQTVVRDLSNS